MKLKKDETGNGMSFVIKSQLEKEAQKNGSVKILVLDPERDYNPLITGSVGKGGHLKKEDA